MKHFGAPWSKSLVILSSLVTALCLALGAGFLANFSGAMAWVAVVPILLLGSSACFAIRGYSLTDDTLFVHRPFWKTRVSLEGLQSVQLDFDAMRGSIRLLGNGGLFSFSGWFRNKALGTYRAWVTDPRQTVVLRFVTKRVVLSPSEPEAFVAAIGLARRMGPAWGG